MKHEPIALASNATPSVFIISLETSIQQSHGQQKKSTLKGPPSTLHSTMIREDDKIADDVIRIPQVPQLLKLVLTIVSLPLLSCSIAYLAAAI